MRRFTVIMFAVATLSCSVLPQPAKALPLALLTPLRETITPLDEVRCQLPPWYAHGWVRNAPFLCQRPSYLWWPYYYYRGIGGDYRYRRHWRIQ